MAVRWIFGDQLGGHFSDDVASDASVLLVESRGVFRRRRFHRQKAHLVLSAMRHRAAELGDRCTYLRADTYTDALAEFRADGGLTVCHPTSYAALRFVQSRSDVEVLPARGFVTSHEDFARWADGRARLVMEDFYRQVRHSHDLLMDGSQPAGGRWNFDAENREPAPKTAVLADAVGGLDSPWWPTEDEIDDEVRHDLDRWERAGDVSFVGVDGPRRFAATAAEARSALGRFVDDRLRAFGPHEDAMLSGDAWMAHSLLSAPMNLGLLDPLTVARQAEQAFRDGAAPLASVEGFIRQVVGWRDYVWNLYWYEGEGYRRENALHSGQSLPQWFADLDADAVEANCLASVLRDLRAHGWVHHIPRLMVLGNYAMQRGWRPTQVLDWFHRCFVDGYDWVMVPNAIGMSQYADGGVMATKPYAGGGSYINRMSDYCAPCRYRPTVRVGPDACPFTAGYWWFLARNRPLLAGNHRLSQPLAGLARLADLDALVEQEQARGAQAP